MWHIEHLSIEPLLLTFSKVIDSEGDDVDDGGDDDGGDDDESEEELLSDDCEQLGQEEHSEGNEGGQTNLMNNILMMKETQFLKQIHEMKKKMRTLWRNSLKNWLKGM